MAKKGSSDKKGSGKGKGSVGGKYRSAISGRYVTTKHGKSHPKTTVREVGPEAKEFSRQFNEKYRETLRDLSER